MPLPSAGDWGTPLVVSTSTGKPKPWSTGEVAGTCVDSRDHVFIVTRGNLVNSPETLDSVPAAPVIEFDPPGDVVNAWGHRNVLPNGIHGCFVDYQDNLWIAGNGDGIVQKYSHDGTKLLLQIGTRGKCDWPANNNACGNSGGDPSANQSKTLLNQPANVYDRPGPRPGDRTARQHLHRRRLRQPPGRRVFQDNGDGTATWLRQWGGVAGTVKRGHRLAGRSSLPVTAAIRTASSAATTICSTSAIAPMTASRSSARPARCSGSFRSFPAPA
jgi:hypothetical protein